MRSVAASFLQCIVQVSQDIHSLLLLRSLLWTGAQMESEWQVEGETECSKCKSTHICCKKYEGEFVAYAPAWLLQMETVIQSDTSVYL